MGFFSWITSDTKESIRNKYTKKGPLPVYLLIPKEFHDTFGTDKLYESSYDGYGVFHGIDAYALLAKMNLPEKCNGNVDHDRTIGIYLQPEMIKYPLKFVENANLSYEDAEASEEDPNQGFFLSDNEVYDEDENYIDEVYDEDIDEDDDGD